MTELFCLSDKKKKENQKTAHTYEYENKTNEQALWIIQRGGGGEREFQLKNFIVHTCLNN